MKITKIDSILCFGVGESQSINFIENTEKTIVIKLNRDAIRTQLDSIIIIDIINDNRHNNEDRNLYL